MEHEYPSGATPLDPEEQEGLLLGHITTQGELNRWEQENISDAILWFDAHPPRDVLTMSFARDLHKRMFGTVWRWAGEFRRSQKNIGVPWAQIPVELRKMFDTVRYWMDNRVFDEVEIAARFHHLLVSVHCFPNGNGRHARLHTDLLMESRFDREPLLWGGGDLVSPGDVRTEYIGALHTADRGDYGPLLLFLRK